MTQGYQNTWPIHPALVSTVHELPGFRLRSMGIVNGSDIREAPPLTLWKSKRHEVAAHYRAGRQQALIELMRAAAQLGANAIVGVRYETNHVVGPFGAGSWLTEIVAHGTAVWADQTA